MKKILVFIIGFIVSLSFTNNTFAFNKAKANKVDTKVIKLHKKEVKFIQLKVDRNVAIEDEIFLQECESGGLPDKCCPYWSNKVAEKVVMIAGVWPRKVLETSCTTGGTNRCNLGNCSSGSESQ